MSRKIKITNDVNMDLVIPEIGVRLSGKGSTATIDHGLLESSPTLRDFILKRWVRILYIGASPMPHWPFYAPPPSVSDIRDTHSANPPDNTKVEDILSGIKEILQKLVDKQPSPEVLATHIAVQHARINGSNPGAVHTAGKIDDSPEFIPQKIVPTENLDISVKTHSGEIVKGDFDDASKALKNMKKGKR